MFDDSIKKNPSYFGPATGKANSDSYGTFTDYEGISFEDALEKYKTPEEVSNLLANLNAFKYEHTPSTVSANELLQGAEGHCSHIHQLGGTLLANNGYEVQHIGYAADGDFHSVIAFREKGDENWSIMDYGEIYRASEISKVADPSTPEGALAGVVAHPYALSLEDPTLDPDSKPLGVVLGGSKFTYYGDLREEVSRATGIESEKSNSAKVSVGSDGTVSFSKHGAKSTQIRRLGSNFRSLQNGLSLCSMSQDPDGDHRTFSVLAVPDFRGSGDAVLSFNRSFRSTFKRGSLSLDDFSVHYEAGSDGNLSLAFKGGELDRDLSIGIAQISFNGRLGIEKKFSDAHNGNHTTLQASLFSSQEAPTLVGNLLRLANGEGDFLRSTTGLDLKVTGVRVLAEHKASLQFEAEFRKLLGDPTSNLFNDQINLGVVANTPNWSVGFDFSHLKGRYGSEQEMEAFLKKNLKLGEFLLKQSRFEKDGQEGGFNTTFQYKFEF